MLIVQRTQRWAPVFILLVVCGCNDRDRFIRMTDAELVAELARPKNRMPNTWRDYMGSFEISENGCGGRVSAMVDFGGSVPPAVSYATNNDYSRVCVRPLVLTPLLSHYDPEIVLTTLFIYQKLFGLWSNKYKLSGKDRDIEIVADRIRQGPLRQVDTRVRWMSLDVLSDLHCIAASDITASLGDPSLAIRSKALFVLMDWRQANTQVFYPPGTKVIQEPGKDGGTYRTTIYGPTYDICILDQQYRELLVPALIDRLEDPHPWIRQYTWDHLTALVSYVEPCTASTTRPMNKDRNDGYRVVMPLPHPDGPDWRWLVQESWQTRHAAVEQIRETWKKQSYLILQKTQACREYVAAGAQ